ncbi:MAG: HNH endonuclease, partial [Isosphaeraceae bacterium]
SLFKGPDDEFIRTVHFEIQVPRIIRLLAYDRLPRQKVKFNRRNIFARDGNRCQYCGRKFATSELSLDHVVPRSQGGRAAWENIVCACLKCNVRKGGRTPREASMRDFIASPPSPGPAQRFASSYPTASTEAGRRFSTTLTGRLSWNEPSPAGGVTRRPLGWGRRTSRTPWVDDSKHKSLATRQPIVYLVHRVAITT